MEEKQMLKITDETGVEKEVEVLSYFTLNSNGKKYLIYTENVTDESGNVEIYTSEVVEKEDDSIELYGVEDENVWNEIKQVMIDLAKEGE
ncbi:MAG: DUF1292 domain-containing protein [Bacilli bacterium]|nr:DUF1292 domain-containing protein [Bacilli bacterium]MDD4733600.1 DUF1292 domain-containing protein [Bacilli bacterium]